MLKIDRPLNAFSFDAEESMEKTLMRLTSIEKAFNVKVRIAPEFKNSVQIINEKDNTISFLPDGCVIVEHPKNGFLIMSKEKFKLKYGRSA